MAAEHLSLMEWFENLPLWMEQGAYCLIFFALFLSGVGLPIPEELSFLLGGYLADSTGGSLILMIFFAVLGVLLGDIVLFFLARRHGERLLSVWPFRLLFTPARLTRGRAFFSRHGSKTIFCAGFFAGIRATTFFLSSTMGVKFSHFLFWDSVRTLLTCPVSVWVGYRFGPYAHEIIKPYKDWLLLGIVLVVVALIVRERVRRRKRLKSPLLAAGEAVSCGASSDAKGTDSQLKQSSERS
jgi:membrane protein DedA with SNARE-associated domain